MKKLPFIYITAFFCGMSIMAIELSASRLLAPFFGTSSIVWTVVIGIIMISLSIGNVLGGRLADKYNSMDKLYSLLWISSIVISIIPLVGKYIIALITVILMWVLPQSLLVAGSIISCLVIFSIPLVILGIASPYLVKLGVSDFNSNGKTTGQIYAISTIGSIIGTFIPTFLTIPSIGTSKTFYVFSLVLNFICMYYFISSKRKYIRTIISFVIIAVLLFAPLNLSYAFWKSNILYEGESEYNYLQVAEEGDSVILSTNVAFGVQSVYKKNNQLPGFYYDYALLAPFFIKDMNFSKKLDALVLGMGTGTFAKQCKRFFPNTSTDGVEIDQKIVDLSRKYFDLAPEDANIYVNDGRTFLSTKDAGKYDLILVDAYHDITIPFHMSTREFFLKVKEHLNPNGILLVNINMRSEKNTEINDYLTQTLKSTMKKVYSHNIKYYTNTLLYSSDDENCLNNFYTNSRIIPQNSPLSGIAAALSSNVKEISDAKLIFTDEIAPVELLGQKVLDDIILTELNNFKKKLDSSDKGIMGIFDML